MKCLQEMHSKNFFVNFSQISGQDPITFLRISASCAVVLRITQNYAEITNYGQTVLPCVSWAFVLTSKDYKINLEDAVHHAPPVDSDPATM